MLLARTDPDRSKAHRGLSLFVVEKPRGDGTGFVFTQDPATEGRRDPPGRMEGRPIDTIGYRGMHSYEISFENWFVPAANLVGGDDGVGRGFYLQMAGFENGRLQTAARALGRHAGRLRGGLGLRRQPRGVRRPIGEYQLTQAKLARMAVLIQATRQFSYEVARLMAKGEGTLEASMLKAYVCRAAEWVTREAMQIHGGMGYAEEYPVSRYFVDARVLSIFEGADETLALKVVARRLRGAGPTERLASGPVAERRQPARSPRMTNLVAILRLASSIISSPNMTAPLRSSSVALLVGVEDVPGPVELLLGRRVHLVQHGDLVRGERPLAVVAEHPRALGEVPQPVHVLDLADRGRR